MSSPAGAAPPRLVQPVPAAPLALGLAGLTPFAWGALTMLVPDLAGWSAGHLGPRFAGPYVQLSYGIVILSFMGGALWGFSSRAGGAVAASGYALSVVPALWAFLLVSGGPVAGATYLALGFAGLLGLDWLFWRHGLAPPWWMALRLGLTLAVLVCLAPIML